MEVQAQATKSKPIAPPYDSLKTALENIYDTDQGIREKLG